MACAAAEPEQEKKMDGYDWGLIAVTMAVCGMAYWLLCRDKADWAAEKEEEKEQGRKQENGEEKTQNKQQEKQQQKKQDRGALWYSAVMSLLAMGIAVMMCTVYRENQFLFSLKRLCLIAVIWPAAYVDYKTYRIPNSLIGAGLTMRLVIFMLELFSYGSQAWYILLSELIAAGAVFLAMVLCNMMVKNSIGFGDMKLFILMGLMLGSEGIWGAVFLSLVIEFVMAAILLLRKKKGRKDVIPFGPAIVAGTYLSVFLTGM